MKMTSEHKLKLALLIRKKQDAILDLNSSKGLKTEAWNEIYKGVVAESAPIPNVHNLRQSTWGNMKRTTKNKAPSTTQQNFTQLDPIVLDIMGPASIGVVKEPTQFGSGGLKQPNTDDNLCLDPKQDFEHQPPEIFSKEEKNFSADSDNLDFESIFSDKAIILSGKFKSELAKADLKTHKRSTDLSRLPDCIGLKPTFFTKEHKFQLALLIQRNKGLLLSSFTPKIAKARKWEDIYQKMISLGAHVKNMTHLRQTVWDNIKRVTKAKILSGSQHNFTQLDHIVLDIIGPGIGIKLEPVKSEQPDHASSFSLESYLDIKGTKENVPKTVFSSEHKIKLALLIQKNQDILLGFGTSLAAKTEKWKEIYNELTSQGAQLRNLNHLRWDIWDNMKRRANGKQSSGSSHKLTHVDHLVLDIIRSSTVVKKQCADMKLSDLEPRVNSSTNSGVELPKVQVKTEVGGRMQLQCTKCLKSFRMKYSLKRHNELFHEEKTTLGDKHKRKGENFKGSSLSNKSQNGASTTEDSFISNDYDYSNFSMSLAEEGNNSNEKVEDTRNIFELCNELERKLSDFPLVVKTPKKQMKSYSSVEKKIQESKGTFQEKIKTSIEFSNWVTTDKKLMDNTIPYFVNLDEDSLAKPKKLLQFPRILEKEIISTLSYYNGDPTPEQNNMKVTPADFQSPLHLSDETDSCLQTGVLLKQTTDTEAVVQEDFAVKLTEPMPLLPLSSEHNLITEKELNLIELLNQSLASNVDPDLAIGRELNLSLEKSLNLFKESLLNLSNTILPEESGTSLSNDLVIKTPESRLNLTTEKVDLFSNEIMPDALEQVQDGHISTFVQNDSAIIKVEPGTFQQEWPFTSSIPQIIDRIENGRYFCLRGQCKTEGKPFQGSRELRQHFQITHALPEEQEIKCQQCDLKFKSKKYLEFHVEQQHSLLLKCNVCDKIFGSKKPFSLHLMTHSNDRPHVCKTCGASYITKGSLKLHNQRAHLKTLKKRPRNFLCSLCGNGFISNSVLNTHISSVHMEARIYRCGTCPKSYKTKSQLTQHEEKHEQVSFPCKQCKLVFDCTAYLKKHMRRKKLSCSSFVNTNMSSC